MWSWSCCQISSGDDSRGGIRRGKLAGEDEIGDRSRIIVESDRTATSAPDHDGLSCERGSANREGPRVKRKRLTLWMGRRQRPEIDVVPVSFADDREVDDGTDTCADKS